MTELLKFLWLVSTKCRQAIKKIWKACSYRYLDRNNVSAKHGLHVVCTAGELSGLVELPGLVEGTERGVNDRDAGRGRAQGRVHHHVLTHKHAA